MKPDILKMMNIIIEPNSVDSLLDESMPLARQEAAFNLKNVLKAVTVTLNPRHHQEQPLYMRKIFKNDVKRYICNSNSQLFSEIHYEFQENSIIHFHLVLIGRVTTIGKMVAHFKKFYGHTLVKDIYDMKGWQCYLNDISLKKTHPNVYPISYYYKK